MQRPALTPAGATAPGRRLIVAVVGDSNLDAAAMKPHKVAGDEGRKQQQAEEVSTDRP